MRDLPAFWITAALLIGASPAIAQDAGFYIGAGIGGSKGDLRGDRIDAALAAGGAVVSSRTDDNDVSYRVVLGHRLDRWLALEAAYVDLGEYRYTAAFGGSSRTFSSKSWAAGISGLIFYPITPKLEVFARAGLHATEVKAEAITVGGVTARIGETESGFSPSIGAGLSSDVLGFLTIRLEYDRYLDVGNANTIGEMDINAAAVTAILRF